MSEYLIRKRGEFENSGPYTLQVLKAFIVAGKFSEQDRVVLSDEETIPLLEIEELEEFWKGRGLNPAGGGSKRKRRSRSGKIVFSKGKVLAPGPLPDFAGKLSKNPPLKVLYYFMMSHKTGRIHFRSERSTIDAFLEKGKIIHLASNISRTRLGEIIVQKGLLGSDMLKTALEEAQNTQRPLGQVLQHSYLSLSELNQAFDWQFEQRLRELFRWKAGIYRYYDNQVTGATFPLQVDLYPLLKDIVFVETPESMLMDYTQRLLHRRLLRIAHPLLTTDHFQLDRKQCEFLDSISNRDSYDDVLGDTVDKGILKEQDIHKTVYLLWQVGLLESDKEMMGQRIKAKIKELDKAISRMKKQSRLERLGLSGGSTPDDIRQAYLGKAKIFHPDQLAIGTHTEIKKRTEEAFALIVDAYEVLHG